MGIFVNFHQIVVKNFHTGFQTYWITLLLLFLDFGISAHKTDFIFWDQKNCFNGLVFQ